MSRPAILVTGGARRVGAAIAQAFGAAGWHVIIHYRRSGDAAGKLAATLPSAQIVKCDLADGDSAVRMIEELAAAVPDWRVLVNNASIFPYDDVTQLNPAANARSMQINAVTPARLSQAFFAKARAAGGRRVIQITDQKLENPNPDFFSYTMSKYALAATIPMLRMGASGTEDRVYGLAPGAILASHDQTKEETEHSHRLNLLGRKTQLAELAGAALFLADGWLASGETLFVDSGQHLLKQSRDVIYLARGEGQP